MRNARCIGGKLSGRSSRGVLGRGGGEEGRGLAPPPLQTCRIFFSVILRHQTSCNDRITYYYSTLSFSLHLPWNICQFFFLIQSEKNTYILKNLRLPNQSLYPLPPFPLSTLIMQTEHAKQFVYRLLNKLVLLQKICEHKHLSTSDTP